MCCDFQPAQFQQQARQVAANQYGTPMATSTQMSSMGGGGGGGMYSGGMYGGARQQHDSGMTPLQQQVLNTISQCLSDTGIDINDLVRTMGQHGHNEAKVRYTPQTIIQQGSIGLYGFFIYFVGVLLIFCPMRVTSIPQSMKITSSLQTHNAVTFKLCICIYTHTFETTISNKINTQ